MCPPQSLDVPALDRASTQTPWCLQVMAPAHYGCSVMCAGSGGSSSSNNSSTTSSPRSARGGPLRVALKGHLPPAFCFWSLHLRLSACAPPCDWLHHCTTNGAPQACALPSRPEADWRAPTRQPRLVRSAGSL